MTTLPPSAGSLSRAFALQSQGTAEVGLFIPPAEDCSNIVVNKIAEQICNDVPFINLVIFKVAQPNDKRISTRPELLKRRILHSDILHDVIFPEQKKAGLSNLPKDIVLCPELLAEKYPGRVRVVDVKDLNDPDFIQTISNNTALRMAFSVRNLVLFKKPLIDAFSTKGKHCLMNIHPAKLPGIRGLEGPFWTRVEGDTHYHTTLHVIDTGVDTGPVLNVISKFINGDAQKPVAAYMRDIAPKIAEMICSEVTQRLVSGMYRPPLEHDAAESIYRTLPTNAEIRSASENRKIEIASRRLQIPALLRLYANENVDPQHHASLMESLNDYYGQRLPEVEAAHRVAMAEKMSEQSAPDAPGDNNTPSP